MPTLILIYCHFSYIATNKKGEITSEETVHCLFGRGPLPNFLPLLWTRFVGYGASDTGTRNWGRGSRISLCTSAVHTYIYNIHTFTQFEEKTCIFYKLQQELFTLLDIYW